MDLSGKKILNHVFENIFVPLSSDYLFISILVIVCRALENTDNKAEIILLKMETLSFSNSILHNNQKRNEFKVQLPPVINSRI